MSSFNSVNRALIKKKVASMFREEISIELDLWRKNNSIKSDVYVILDYFKRMYFSHVENLFERLITDSCGNIDFITNQRFREYASDTIYLIHNYITYSTIRTEVFISTGIKYTSRINSKHLNYDFAKSCISKGVFDVSIRAGLNPNDHIIYIKFILYCDDSIANKNDAIYLVNKIINNFRVRQPKVDTTFKTNVLGCIKYTDLLM